MNTDFHSELNNYLKNNDSSNALKLILNEVANAIVKDRENFIEVLKTSGVTVMDGATDIQLIDLFVNNAPNNKKLLLGASLLINHRNQVVSFDGESEMDDNSVKSVYKGMESYFCANAEDYDSADGEDGDEEKSNWVGAALGLASAGTQLASKGVEGRQKKKYGVGEQAAQQSAARSELLKKVIEDKQRQTTETLAKEKTRRNITIATISIVGVLALVGLIVYIKKNKG